MGCFWITFILLWWDFLKPALFNSGDAVLVCCFCFFLWKSLSLAIPEYDQFNFSAFSLRTRLCTTDMVILLLKCKVPDQMPHPSIQKNTLCKRRLKYTDCHTRCRNFHVTNKQLFGFTMSSEGSDVAITRSGLECCSKFGRKTTIKTVVLTQCLG